MVVSLIHDAQEIAILNGVEELNLATLSQAYEKRISMLHSYIEPTIKRRSQNGNIRKSAVSASKVSVQGRMEDVKSICELAATAKNTNADIVELLKQYLPVMEVAV